MIHSDEFVNEVYKNVALRLEEGKNRGYKENFYSLVQGVICSMGERDPHTIGKMSQELVPIIEKMQINADDVDYKKIIDYFTDKYGGGLKFTLDHGIVWDNINAALTGENRNIAYDDDSVIEFNKIINVLVELKVFIRSSTNGLTINV